MKLADIVGRNRIAWMHGTKKFFVIVPDFDDLLTGYTARWICEKFNAQGSGSRADGVIALRSPTKPDAIYRMKSFNKDGTTPEMSGNGICCLAKYLVDTDRVGENGKMIIETDDGLVKTNISEYSEYEAEVKVPLGKPVLYVSSKIRPKQICDSFYEEDNVTRLINGFVNDRFISFIIIRGTPHAVVFTNDPEKIIEEYGPLISEQKSVFPEMTDVDFARLDHPNELTVYSWQRGVGRTLSSGTGAAAAFVVGVMKGNLDNKVTAHCEGGDLELSWKGKKGYPVMMTGHAVNLDDDVNIASLDNYIAKAALPTFSPSANIIQS
jgi:diaminopimelate epimerase